MFDHQGLDHIIDVKKKKEQSKFSQDHMRAKPELHSIGVSVLCNPTARLLIHIPCTGRNNYSLERTQDSWCHGLISNCLGAQQGK